jgi:hypothetical protein
MPYVQIWVPAPKDESLVVHATKLISGESYHCQFCGGWIDGEPNRFEEDSLAPLAGRKGTVLHCIRCGYEIDFFGMQS